LRRTGPAELALPAAELEEEGAAELVVEGVAVVNEGGVKEEGTDWEEDEAIEADVELEELSLAHPSPSSEKPELQPIRTDEESVIAR